MLSSPGDLFSQIIRILIYEELSVAHLFGSTSHQKLRTFLSDLTPSAQSQTGPNLDMSPPYKQHLGAYDISPNEGAH